VVRNLVFLLAHLAISIAMVMIVVAIRNGKGIIESPLLTTGSQIPPSFVMYPSGQVISVMQVPTLRTKLLKHSVHKVAFPSHSLHGSIQNSHTPLSENIPAGHFATQVASSKLGKSESYLHDVHSVLIAVHSLHKTSHEIVTSRPLVFSSIPALVSAYVSILKVLVVI
jgi:hypothetical protein